MKQPTILGAICGDVIGSTYESRRSSTKDYNFELYTSYARPTDDTVLTAAIADWLLHDKWHSASSLTASIVKYANRYPNAGFGRSFREWMTTEDHKPYNSWGNGSAMRVSPVAYCFDTLEEVLEMAKVSAEVTHNHPEGVKGAQATASAIFMARTGCSKDDIKKYVEREFGYDLHRTLDSIRPTYRFRSNCQESVPESIICFLESKDYEDCIRLAISMGGDADTMAAIAGSIAAAFYNDIPDEIVNFVVPKLPSDLKAIEEEFQAFITKREIVKDSIRGSLMAGAAGDALGYPVEFIHRKTILSQYGERGITQFELNHDGKAEVSDDTQMTLFTANGMLMGITRGYMRGIGGTPECYVQYAYMDWLYTQTHNPAHAHNSTWLKDLPELAHRRAPGNTCLTAIEQIASGHEVTNNSKGCGGIMRVAPIGLLIAAHEYYDMEQLATAGAEIAKVTHKHPLGFLPAGLLAVLVYRFAKLSKEDIILQLDEILRDVCGSIELMYKGEYQHEKRQLLQITNRAIRLAKSDTPGEIAIKELGEGWVAEEAWAISLYCALRHIDSLEDAIIASVNHNGDSDSTGSITGNIMGAIYGYEYLKERNVFCPNNKSLEDTLELSEITLALADDLFRGCPISEYMPIDTPAKQQWYERYCEMRPCGIKCVEEDCMKIEYLFFWGHHEKPGKTTKACLSQWYPCKFAIDDNDYNCMEQYMMACKARIMGDKETLRKILAAQDPKEIKDLGRQIKGFDSERWDICKKDVVVLGNLAKFTQNKSLREFLLSTEDKVIVEASPYDTVWGIGLSADDKDAKDPAKWRGKNLLGYALVEVREMLKGLNE